MSNPAPLSREALLGHGAMALFSALVAGSFALGAKIAHLIEPAPLNALRFLVAACLMSTVAYLAGKASAETIARARRAPWRYGVLAFCMVTYFVLMFKALKTVSAVSTAAVFTLTPILSAGFGWLLLRQITTPRIALGLSIGAVGALWVVFRADLGALLSLDLGYGEAIFFVGCAMHALYTPLVRKLNRGEPAILFTAGMLIAGALMLLVMNASALWSIDWAGMPERFWLILAYLSLVTTGFTFFLVQFATMRLPASKVMAYTYVTPAWVIVWERGLGHPWPTIWIVLGVGVCCGALVLLLKA